MGFFVSRRITSTGENTVEVTYGRVRPDALEPEYDGEGIEWHNLEAAQHTALNIMQLWQRDAPHLRIHYGL